MVDVALLIVGAQRGADAPDPLRCCARPWTRPAAPIVFIKQDRSGAWSDPEAGRSTRFLDSLLEARAPDDTNQCGLPYLFGRRAWADRKAGHGELKATTMKAAVRRDKPAPSAARLAMLDKPTAAAASPRSDYSDFSVASVIGPASINV